MEAKYLVAHITDLEVEVDDLLMVHVGDALQDLLHEAHARALRQHELVLDHSVEQLSATDARNVIATFISWRQFQLM